MSMNSNIDVDMQEVQLNYDNAGSEMKNLKVLQGVGHNDMMMSDSYFISLKRFFDSWSSL